MSKDETIALIAEALSRHAMHASLDRLGIKIGEPGRPGYSVERFEADVAKHTPEHRSEAEAVYNALHKSDVAQRTGAFPVMHFVHDHGVDYAAAQIMFAHYLKHFGARRPNLTLQECRACDMLVAAGGPTLTHELSRLAESEIRRRQKDATS